MLPEFFYTPVYLCCQQHFFGQQHLIGPVWVVWVFFPLEAGRGESSLMLTQGLKFSKLTQLRVWSNEHWSKLRWEGLEVTSADHQVSCQTRITLSRLHSMVSRQALHDSRYREMNGIQNSNRKLFHCIKLAVTRSLSICKRLLWKTASPSTLYLDLKQFCEGTSIRTACFIFP